MVSCGGRCLKGLIVVSGIPKDGEKGVGTNSSDAGGVPGRGRIEGRGFWL